MITLTPSATEKVRDILAEENNPTLKLRIFVQGGGCSGFQYGFTLDETQAEDDWIVELDGIGVLVDSASGTYLRGAILDYEEELHGSQFKIINPNATSTCGCGSSFSPF